MINYYKFSAFTFLVFLVAACSQQTAPKTAEQIRDEEATKAADAVDAAAAAASVEYEEAKKLIDRSGVLRKDLKPTTKIPPFFGINISSLTPNELNVLKSAGADFQRIKKGSYPTCTPEPEFGVADGGSLQYDCGDYVIVRQKSLFDENGESGYLYGPSIDFLNGNAVQDIIFYSTNDLNALEDKADGL